MKDCSAWNGRGYDLVVHANDPTLLDKIRQSAEKGRRLTIHTWLGSCSAFAGV